ncbi:hypothetical protein RRG08_052052 [Elysia crispata]|uniref:Uncharacterized protein n=1 Tax=Elysia crispata TaxID=231223 RepID=A0AAE1A4F3_9GAST|nr:hypothetical protein RRG08_052052 [Elysia crispata]
MLIMLIRHKHLPAANTRVHLGGFHDFSRPVRADLSMLPGFVVFRIPAWLTSAQPGRPPGRVILLYSACPPVAVLMV